MKCYSTRTKLQWSFVAQGMLVGALFIKRLQTLQHWSVKYFQLCADYLVDLLTQNLILGALFIKWLHHCLTMRRCRVKDFLPRHFADHMDFVVDFVILSLTLGALFIKWLQWLQRLQLCLTMSRWSMKDLADHADFMVGFVVDFAVDFLADLVVLLVVPPDGDDCPRCTVYFHVGDD